MELETDRYVTMRDLKRLVKQIRTQLSQLTFEILAIATTAAEHTSQREKEFTFGGGSDVQQEHLASQPQLRHVLQTLITAKLSILQCSETLYYIRTNASGNQSASKLLPAC